MGHWYRHIYQLMKYGLSGLAATLTQIAVLQVLSGSFGWNYLIGTSVGYLLAFVVSFGLQKYWTFRERSRERIYRQAAGHFTLGALNLFANGGLMYLLHGRLGWHAIIAQIATAMVISIWSFLIYRYVIFDKTKAVECEKKCRLLIAAGIYPPDFGGPATYAKSLMDDLPSRSWTTAVVAYGEGEPDQGVTLVRRRSNKPIQYLDYARKVRRLAATHDLVYAMGPVSEGLPAMVGAALASRPYLLKVVGDYAWEQARQRYGVEDGIDDFQGKQYGSVVRLIRAIERMVARRARLVIVPSEYLKKIVQGWGVADDRIRVIYNSVRLPDALADRAALRSAFGWSGFIAVTAGRLVPWKGFDQLIEAWARLPGADGSRLYIAGDGPDRERLEKQIAQHGLGERVIMTGALAQAKLWEYIKAADLFLLNSGYEGLSHTIIEAMALGTPVAASKQGGNPELITDGEDGLIFEYNDQAGIVATISRTFNDPDGAKGRSATAQTNLSRFTPEVMIERTIETLNETMEESSRK